MQLTCIDYANWGTTPEFAHDLLQAVKRDGFVLLANHPISKALSTRAFACAQDFFALPLQEKNDININLSENHRGYFALGQEKLDRLCYPQGDAKEGLKIGRDLRMDHPLVQARIPLHGPNQWPKSTEFKTVMQELFTTCLETSHVLMDAFALALHLPQGYFANMFNEPMATLSPLHYPLCQEGFSIGAGTHTDFGCLTLVLQDSTPGLQVWDANNQQWVDVPADPDLLVVNVGDMLERWSNYMLPSTRHRVVTQSERFSFAFFFDPNYDASIASLPGTYNDATPSRHAPISALSYLQQRIGASFDYFAKEHEKPTAIDR